MRFNLVQLDDSHFGRVYIRSKETGCWEPLESARFSKLDLRVYSEDGTTLHPKYPDLTGRRFSIGFKIKNPDLIKKSKTEFEGRIRLPIKLGENLDPDLEHLEESFEMELDMFKKLDLVPTKKAKELIQKTNMSAYWIFCLPGRPILNQEFAHRTIPIVIVDDSFEDHGKDLISSYSDQKKKPKMSFKTLESLKNAVITGNTSDGLGELYRSSTMSFRETLEVIGLGRKILNTVVSVREAAINTGEMHGISPEPFLKTFMKTLTAICVDFSEEWQSKDHLSMISTITGLHHDTVFGILSCEAAALQKGIEVSNRIRDNPLFSMYLKMVAVVYQKFNDLFGYARECEVDGDVGQLANEVYLLHAGKQWPLRKALKKMEDDTNEAMEQLENIGELLLQMYSDDEEHENLKIFLQTVKDVVTGSFQWYAFIDRYHQGIAYDCYIED